MIRHTNGTTTVNRHAAILYLLSTDRSPAARALALRALQAGPRSTRSVRVAV